VGASMDNNFVYPDAYNIDSKVSDDNTSDGAIRWSFANPGGHYSINDRLSTHASAENLDNPSANYSIDGGDDPDAVDALKHTLTFRNFFFSPLPKPASYPDPGTPVGVPSDGQVITLTASDGTTHTLPDANNTFVAYIVNDGNDALSGAGGGGTDLPPIDLTVNNGWVYHEDVSVAGTVSHSGPDANGLCVTVSAAGITIIGWDSQAGYVGTPGTEYNTVTLDDNAVYRARVTATTTAQPGFVPAWELIYDNTVSLYGGAFIFFDSGVNPNAGANSPPAAGTKAVFEAWMNSPGMSTAAFKTQVFNTPANAAAKNFRLKLRALDVDGGGYGAESDTGTICWKKIELTKFDVTTIQVQSVEYNNIALVQAVNATAGTANTQAGAVNILDFSGSGNSTVSFTGGGVTFLPTAAGAATWNITTGNGAFFQMYPGDTLSTPLTNETIDNYSVPWVTDQLYRVVYSLVAPDALSESNPPDFYFIGADVIPNDLISRVYGTTKMGLANMPKQGTPQEFFSFWQGNNLQNVTADTRFNFVRPHFSFGTNNGFVDVPNLGGLRVTGIRMEKVTF